MNHLHSNALRRAAEILGGVPQLAAYIGVSSEDVAAWIEEAKPAPLQAFFDAVDVLARHGIVEMQASSRS